MRALLLLLALFSGVSHAHKPSDSYLAFDANPAGIQGQWDIALRDLEYAIGLDANGDGAITWGELRSKESEVASYALARLAVAAGGQACTLKPGVLQFDEHSDGGYAVLQFATHCPAGDLSIHYALFADLDPTHRGLLRANLGKDTVSAVLGPDRPRITLKNEGRSRWEQFADYFRDGVWHIWIGFDHILFLVSLLLPAVFVASRFAPVFWDVFRVVTAFTVAHSITLSLAALSVIELPSRLVESAIALSVVLAALNNLWPVVSRRRWLVAFAFGLIHGFGFASVLADLGLPREALLVALVGFNLGVEGGQLAIVGAFLPLAYALRGTWFYRRAVFVGGSALVAVIAAAWFAERAFDVKLY